MWSWLADAAGHRPEPPAVGTLTYSELERHARAAADALAVEPGTRVGVALPASQDFAVALHACLWLGATAVPLDLRPRREERARRAQGCARIIDEPLPTGGAGPEPTPLAPT